MAEPHRIRRLRWKVTAAARDDAFDARTQLRQMLDTGLLDEIGHAFDKVVGHDEFVHLSRLDLTVRITAIDQIGAEVGDSIRRELERYAPEAPTRQPESVHRGTSRPPVTSLDSCARLIAYLESGQLPWPLANSGRQAALAYLQQAAGAHVARIVARVPNATAEATRFVLRWLQLVTPDEWTAIGRVVEQSTAVGAGPGLTDALASLSAPRAGLSEHHRAQVVAGLIALAASAATRASSRQHLRSAVSAAFAVLLPVPAPPSSAPPSSAGSAWPEVEAIRARLPPAAATWVGAYLESCSDATGPAPIGTGEQLRGASSSNNGASIDAVVAAKESGGDTFGLSVEHAGLILLHPFLPMLFERTGLVSPGQSVLAEASVPRAAALLSYLALGEDTPIEFELPLVKLLLGLRPDAALPIAAGLIDLRDRQEADDVLASAVEHWRALKQTSIAALRGSFLQRRGLLAETDDGWQLRVEGQPFDLLLDYLPWGISMVKLRWMTTPLFTEWTTA